MPSETNLSDGIFYSGQKLEMHTHVIPAQTEIQTYPFQSCLKIKEKPTIRMPA
ncbi:hypothetical protein [Neisseria polysaccharea]|uniref:hypothetical protein n=1 Tax=Neisseria polysaccharea TaxID=489 RepID=UPI0027DEF962|nr:hypothetical protein [Neisseria polysaccharea]